MLFDLPTGGAVAAFPQRRQPCSSIRFTEQLELGGIAPSIGTVGDAYDNGLMESIIGLFKTGCISTTVFHDGTFETLADIEYAVAGWIDWYQPPTAARLPRDAEPNRVRAGPLTLPSTESRNSMRAAQNPCRFS